MNIVFTLSKSKNDFESLKYCLRSIDKHVYGYDEIVIVGELPDWIQGVIHIPFNDSVDDRFSEKIKLKKIISACISSKNIGESFSLFSENSVITKNIDLKKYPFYYGGSCSDYVKENLKKKSSLKILHTMTFLNSRGFKDRNYDIGSPITINKSNFLSTFDDNDINFETKYGYGINSIYCACNRLNGVLAKDFKMSSNVVISDDNNFMTYEEKSIENGVGLFLRDLFKNKSSYEK